MWRTSSARRWSWPSTMRLPGPRRMGLRGAAMELFLKLFGDLLVFVYHCFDRIVIHGYLSGLSRPEQVVHFFRRVVGVPVITKEVLSQRTTDYQNWVEALARNHDIPIEWAEKGVRKEDYVQPWLRKMAKKNAFGVFFIFKEHGAGAELPDHDPEVPDQGSQSPHLGPPEEPLHPQLLLHPRRSTRAHGYAGGDLLSLPDHLLPQRAQLHRTGAQSRKHCFQKERQCIPRRRRCRRPAEGRRQAKPRHHPREARLLDLHSRAQVLRQGTQEDQSVAVLFDCPDRILPELHLQTQLPHSQALRAQLRARAMAAHRQQDRRDLRATPAQENVRQARQRHRPDRARASCLSRVLQARVPEAVREVLDVPAQRALLKRPQGLRSEEELGQS